ncbi:MAG: ATP-binding protein [Chitinispirillales bacterium]|nr:ATP-binding protein [Chitinispirillales bacterium]
MSFKKIPYGLSNFADLIKLNYAYVDKTRFIEFLENENNPYQFFIRPRRFGKSLFLTVLENYYDLNRKDKFEDIFGNLYIGVRQTHEQGKYAVIQFDFSGLNTESRDEFKLSFSNRVQETVRLFLEIYKNIFPNWETLLNSLNIQRPGLGAIDLIYTAAANANVPIFIIIDEYDHFANNLIAMGKTYKDEVKAGGIVRTFYESLKTGTKSVVKRIFITGMNPMMINDLTSGFNMSTDYSLYPKYNEMFGFTREEVEWLMQETGIDKNLIKIDMEYYYNGYMFSGNAENKVYNPQMILYLFNQISISGEQPKQIVDTNLRTDYERLRRLAENENNRNKLLRITQDGGILGDIAEKFSLDKLESEEYFISLLFYLGMLTNGGTAEGQTYLKIPNYSIKTLFWEYLVSYVQDLEKKTVSASEFIKVTGDMAFKGNFKSYLDFFTENYLKRLSNRDLIDFDEKYIKAMLLAALFTSKLYLPISEYENINGYTDIYLQKHPAVPDIKFEYVFELKYVKVKAAKKEKEAAFAEAASQIEKYKKDPRFANRNDIKFIAIVFKGKGDYEVREL